MPWYVYTVAGILIAIAARTILAALWRLLRAVLPVVVTLIIVSVLMRLAGSITATFLPAFWVGALGATIVGIWIYAAGWNDQASAIERGDIERARKTASERQRRV